MIYLRFPSSQDDMVLCAEIKKPNYSDVLETALKEWYTDSLAAKYAKILADSLYEVMNFPQDGIYYVNPETQTFFVFSKESNLWVDTKKKVEDYVISSTDKLWEAIFSKHSFLKKVAELIQSTVEKETIKMFDVKNWNYVNSIDLETYSIIASNQLSESLIFFGEYFSQKSANDIYLEVMKILFSTTSNNMVTILENGALRGLLTSEGFTPFNQLAFIKLEKWLSEILEDAELNIFINRLKNLLLWGRSYSSIITSEKGTTYYIEHNGLTLYTHDRKHFYAKNISVNIFYEYIKQCKVEKTDYGTKNIYNESPDILLEQYGIKIPIYNDGESLSVHTENDDLYCFARLNFKFDSIHLVARYQVSNIKVQLL